MSRSTFSKSRKNYPTAYPDYIECGKGAYVYDGEGNRYIDWVMGLGGTGVFGHAYPPVVKAVQEAAGSGTAFHLAHRLEDEVAELLADTIPWAEDCRFCLNGTDANQGAVRLARAVTGRRDVIVFEGAYHGDSADWAISCKEPARGVCCDWLDHEGNVYRDLHKHTWNDSSLFGLKVDALDLAAVIFEIQSAPTPEMVKALNSVKDSGALLIADEVVTGFRLGRQGACGRYGIEPDLVTYGKAFGSGFPIACLAGCKELMAEFYKDEPVFMSYTHAGNVVGLAAARATLQQIRQDPTLYERLYEGGDLIIDAFRLGCDVARVDGRVTGQKERSNFRFSDPAIAKVFQNEMAKRGVLIGVANMPSAAHDGEVILKSCQAIRESMKSVAQVSLTV